MRRLAYALAAILAIAAAPSARAESLDLDLSRLGAPDPDVWGSIPGIGGADTKTLAAESRRRFATLASELGLALSSAILHPASTTGHSGFAFDLEVAYVPVGTKAVGSAPPGGFTNATWPTRGAAPSALVLPSVHVRKGLPFSLELGGRIIYLNQSSYYAAQGEVKWAVNEGFDAAPDVALRAAHTRLFGQEDLSLGVTDLDLLVSKRFGLNGVSAITPYLAARYTLLSASTGRIDFAPGISAGASAQDAPRTQASFPRFTAGFFRPTVGLRYTVFAVALGLEATWQLGATRSSGGYSEVKVKDALAAAAKLGWEF